MKASPDTDSIPPCPLTNFSKLFWGHQPLLDIRTNWSCAQGKHPRGEARPPSNRSLPNIIKHRKWVRHEIGSIFTVASGPMKASPDTDSPPPCAPHQPLHKWRNYSGVSNPSWISEQIVHVLRERTHWENLGLLVAKCCQIISNTESG